MHFIKNAIEQIIRNYKINKYKQAYHKKKAIKQII